MTNETKASHTPGKWRVCDGLEHAVETLDGEWICDCIETPANAKLIAASPDLLDACQKMLEAFEYTGEPLVGVVYRAKENMVKAIAKATGDQ